MENLIIFLNVLSVLLLVMKRKKNYNYHANRKSSDFKTSRQFNHLINVSDTIFGHFFLTNCNAIQHVIINFDSSSFFEEGVNMCAL